MKGKRRLSMETLERRIVLDGFGLADPSPVPAWESVIVALNDNVRDPDVVARGVIKAHGGQLGHVYEHAVKGFSAQLPEAAVQALLRNPQVKRIEPDLTMQAFAQVTPTGIDRIDADLNPTAKINGIDERVDVDVAILDTGIDGTHPDLNVAGGYNTTSRFITKWNDGNGHGTHVAGTVAALDNGFGVVGVAPGARLWAVKVLADNGTGSLSNIIKGIDWVTKNAATIEVANMSLGGQGVSSTYREAIQRSVAAGVVYVVAAGNEYRDILGGDLTFGTSDDTIPAVYPEVATISAMADSDGKPGGVGSATSYGYLDDTFADFSNFSNSKADGSSWYSTNNVVNSPGLGIDLMMPGVDILSTYKGGGYATGSGTSMAAPHAAGLAALYIAEHARANNTAEVYSIRQALITAGKPWRSVEGLVVVLNPGGGNDDSPDKHEENLGWAGSSSANAPPVAQNDSGTTEEDTPITVAVLENDSDPDGNTIHVSAVTQGASGSVEISGDNTVTYTPALNFYGQDTFTYTISDGKGGTDSAVVTVTVTAVPDSPVAVDDVAATTVNTAVTISVLQNDFDPDGDPLTVVSITNGSRGAAVIDKDDSGNPTGTITYTPGTDFVGSDSFVYTVSDGTGRTDTATVWVTVDPPSAATLRVGDLDGTSVWVNKRKWAATVTVLVQDGSGLPVPNATVTGTWSNGIQSTASTNATGLATVTSGNMDISVASVTFAVTGIQHATFTYDANANTDPDGDSSGTSILVYQNGTTAAPTSVARESLSVASSPLTAATTPRSAQAATAVGTLFIEQHTEPVAGPAIDEPVSSATTVDEALADLDTAPLDDELLEDLALAVL